MVKEFFGLSLKETFATYTLLSSTASIVGIILILLMDASVYSSRSSNRSYPSPCNRYSYVEGIRKKKNAVEDIGA